MNMTDTYAKMLALARDPKDLQALMGIISQRPKKRTAVNPYRKGMKGNTQALKSPPERRV